MTLFIRTTKRLKRVCGSWAAQSDDRSRSQHGGLTSTGCGAVKPGGLLNRSDYAFVCPVRDGSRPTQIALGAARRPQGPSWFLIFVSEGPMANKISYFYARLELNAFIFVV